MPGSSVVAVLNICEATCRLWLGCKPLTEIPDANRPGTKALGASSAEDWGRVIALQACFPAPVRRRAPAHRGHAIHDRAPPGGDGAPARAGWHAPQPTDGR